MRVSVACSSVAPHVRQTVMAYYDANFLDLFYTSFFFHPQYNFSNFLGKSGFIINNLKRRSFDSLPIAYFKSRPIPELIRTFSSIALIPSVTDIIWEWADLGFDSWVAKQIGKNIDAIHVYEHSGLNTITKAKKLGILTIHEQSSVHESFLIKIMEGQIQLYPEFSSHFTMLENNIKTLRRSIRKGKQLELADIILCNSSFTKRSLLAAGFSENKIKVIPLAFPKPIEKIKPKKKDTPIRFLYAGNQSFTKGIHLLYQAWKNCSFAENDVELWVIGKMMLPKELITNLPGKVVIKDNIPNHELMELYSSVDVFILPTLSDGFGMVVTEAMSQGVPVIATENCCAPDIIENNKNGWIIPAGCINSLTKQMLWCSNNRDKLPEFGGAALLKAAEWQWQDYRKKLAKLIEDSCKNRV